MLLCNSNLVGTMLWVEILDCLLYLWRRERMKNNYIDVMPKKQCDQMARLLLPYFGHLQQWKGREHPLENNFAKVGTNFWQSLMEQT